MNTIDMEKVFEGFGRIFEQQAKFDNQFKTKKK